MRRRAYDDDEAAGAFCQAQPLTTGLAPTEMPRPEVVQKQARRASTGQSAIPSPPSYWFSNRNCKNLRKAAKNQHFQAPCEASGTRLIAVLLPGPKLWGSGGSKLKYDLERSALDRHSACPRPSPSHHISWSGGDTRRAL